MYNTRDIKRGRTIIKKEKYLAELTRLLAFMSPWDRKTAIRRYERMFETAEDEDALLDQLGTPTSVAVKLAKDYVSSPPPENAPEIETFDGEEAEQLSFETLAAEEEAAAEEPAAPEARGASAGAQAVYWLLAVVIGLPVAALLFCVGVPFMASGAGAAVVAAHTVSEMIGGFNLLSDSLLLIGGGLILAALGLLIVWLGLWVGISLVRLWVGKVILPLGRRLRYGKEARA